MLRKLFGISKCIVAGHTETHTMVAKVTPWTWPTGRLLRGVDNIYTHIGLRCCVLGLLRCGSFVLQYMARLHRLLSRSAGWRFGGLAGG